MRILITVALLILQVACNAGAPEKKAPVAEAPTPPAPEAVAEAKAPKGCEQDPECKKDLEQYVAGKLTPEVDILGEVTTYFSRNAATPEDDTTPRELRAITLPGSGQKLRLWATNRIGSGACFTVKLVAGDTGKTAWSEEALCDVRVLGIQRGDVLLKVAARPGTERESHAAPKPLQFTYYAWDAQTGTFKKTKALVTRARL